MKYDFVLFDADNTLFDFDLAEHLALAGALRAIGLPDDDATEARYLSLNRPLWQAFDRGETTIAALTVERFRLLLDALDSPYDPADFNRDYLRRLGDCGQLLPGALSLVQTLAPHCTLAVITNGVTSVQKSRFAVSPLTPYLSGVFVSQELGVRKPEPLFFDAVCRSLGIENRSRAVVVGDSLTSDICGARRAGMDSILYAPGGSDSPLPTHTITALDCVSALILGDLTE
ncbi:MAG: YjjG family noncanonical pyrimidine nucleotidase [Oscillospiraceae bacterium]